MYNLSMVYAQIVLCELANHRSVSLCLHLWVCVLEPQAGNMTHDHSVVLSDHSKVHRIRSSVLYFGFSKNLNLEANDCTSESLQISPRTLTFSNPSLPVMRRT